jgi:hypothetical protein
MKSLITPGRYRHYKGKDYQVIGSARHTETEEDLVLYFPLYGDEAELSYWVRPLGMFKESVVVDGKSMARFSLQQEVSAETANEI